MDSPQRKMRLTERHVAALAARIPDPGPQVFVGRRPAAEADYEAVVAEMLAASPADGFWLFAYGSLIWNPVFEFDRSQVARARGWRRRFCLGWDYRFRGSMERPGVMMALDRGGECTGVVYRIPFEALEVNLDRLIRREMSMVPSAFPPRWIKVETAGGPLRALTFAMDRNSGRYIHLDTAATADVLATACGFWGSMAEYLHYTVARLEALGIHDRHLWKLQEMVAERIEQAHGLAAAEAGLPAGVAPSTER